jgi:hypothetical protein
VSDLALLVASWNQSVRGDGSFENNCEDFQRVRQQLSPAAGRQVLEGRHPGRLGELTAIRPRAFHVRKLNYPRQAPNHENQASGHLQLTATKLTLLRRLVCMFFKIRGFVKTQSVKATRMIWAGEQVSGLAQPRETRKEREVPPAEHASSLPESERLDRITVLSVQA